MGAVCVVRDDSAPSEPLLRSVSTELDDAGPASPIELDDAGPVPPDGGPKKFIQPQGRCECDSRACEGDMVCSSRAGACITGCDETKPCKGPGEYCDVFMKKCFAESGWCDSVADCPEFDPRASSALRRSCEEHSCRLLAISPEPLMLAPFSADEHVVVTAPAPGHRFASTDAVEFSYRALTPSTMLVVTRGHPDTPRSLQERGVWWGFSKGEGQTTLRWDEGHGLDGDRYDLPAPPVPKGEQLYLVVQALERGERVGVSAAIPFAVGKPWPAVDDRCDPKQPVSCANPSEALACVLGVCMRVCASYADCAPYAAGGCTMPMPPEVLWRTCR